MKLLLRTVASAFMFAGILAGCLAILLLMILILFIFAIAGHWLVGSFSKTPRP